MMNEFDANFRHEEDNFPNQPEEMTSIPAAENCGGAEPTGETAEFRTAEQPAEPLRIRLDQPAEPETSAAFAAPEYVPGIVRQKPYHEHIKSKSRAKRYIAAGTAVAVINLAILGGIFGVGYSFGKRAQTGSGQIAASLRSDTAQTAENGENSGNLATTLAASDDGLSTTEIAKKVGPAVVGITSRLVGQISWFGTQTISEGQGSGIIISADGYIVTNNHVIDGASEITVTLNTGTEIKASVKGADSKTDLAVIKIDSPEPLTVAELGDSNAVEVGERAIAIGNPMGLEFFGSVTQGIISAVNRTISVDDNGSGARTMNVIQTDAAINEGNSGGALVNGRGQVIGINAVKISSTSVEGMGFAIPISEAKNIIADLLEYGYVKGRTVIGISWRDVTDYMARAQGWPKGVQVMGVSAGSGAEIAGLEQGDIITKADGQVIENNEQLSAVKEKHVPGDMLECEVYKYSTGLTQTVQIKLSEEKPVNISD